jgi:glyoxylase-like metal-dependent hydrolase (beta-lactamase superfamily II)
MQTHEPIEPYEVYAIKYAEHQGTASSTFIGGDPHDGPMPMDYFIWVASNRNGTWVIDTGFNKTTATKRGRRFVQCPAESLRELGIDAMHVRDVVITHLHYDHVGNFDLFPAARFHIQDKEMQFATGRHMSHRCMHEAYDVENVAGIVREVYQGRVQFHDGDSVLAPGLSVHLVGGHTMGLQVVRVLTERGWIVLASDASHLYQNFVEERPFPIVYSVGDMVLGWSRIRSLADSVCHIVPGHDPAVLKQYPPPRRDLTGLVAALHFDPAISPYGS